MTAKKFVLPRDAKRFFIAIEGVAPEVLDGIEPSTEGVKEVLNKLPFFFKRLQS